MSDTPAAAAPEGKKKGKLPVIAIVAIMLFAGGFFGMKMKGGGKKAPEVKLGKVYDLSETLVNLTNETTFLRCTIGLQMKDGFKEEKFKELGTVIDDAVVLTLKGKSVSELENVNSLGKLKKELATKINAAIESAEPPEEKKGEAKDEPKGEKKKGKKGEATDVAETGEHPDWDSQTGPVLKVYFKAFAIQ